MWCMGEANPDPDSFLANYGLPTEFVTRLQTIWAIAP